MYSGNAERLQCYIGIVHGAVPCFGIANSRLPHDK